MDDSYWHKSEVTLFWVDGEESKDILGESWTNGETKLMSYLKMQRFKVAPKEVTDETKLQEIVDSYSRPNHYNHDKDEIKFTNFPVMESKASLVRNRNGDLVRTVTSSDGITMIWTVPRRYEHISEAATCVQPNNVQQIQIVDTGTVDVSHVFTGQANPMYHYGS